MAAYDHKKIEKKWQKIWEETGANRAREIPNKKKFYALIEFPYPSGAGMHVGHIRSNTAMDAVARKRRGEGYEVLFPIGWDAFGLPTENYAVKTGIHPAVVTKQNTDTFRRQLKMLGFSFNWNREINTTDPSYYKWTQWLFLQFFKKGLAYKAKSFINWCPHCKIGLANEEAVGGVCERCGGPTERREKEQWMLAITKYADRLDRDLNEVDFLEKIKIQQRNWIGRREGAEITFPVADSQFSIEVFTTRADTLFGATYLALAPEHRLIKEIENRVSNRREVRDYILSAGKKTEIERTAEGKEKNGVELQGVKAVNPASGEEIPIYVADYALAYYGTGALMGVPAHDERDYAFAKKFNLPIRQVIEGGDALPCAGEGKLVHSKAFDGMPSAEARKKITAQFGAPKVTYKLRDWIFSRQRYWGEPIPLIKCRKDGWVPVPENELPVVLPAVEEFRPRDDGLSPLASISEWVNTICPVCGGEAVRETDTMPNWAGSSWYYLRYMDPDDKEAFASQKNIGYWRQVDWYNGGMEHTTLHLLYSRFWHKFLFDQELVPTTEPYAKRTSHGLILAGDGSKMSKSKGNVVNPDELVERFGADSLRLYEMFMGPFDQAISWNTDGVVGMRRFLERVHKKASSFAQNEPQQSLPARLEAIVQQTIKKVSEDIEQLKMNTAVSSLMILFNELDAAVSSKESFTTFLRLLAPFAPHLTEELWQQLGRKGSIHQEPWPAYNEKKQLASEVIIVVQINGKTRGRAALKSGASKEEQEKAAREAVADKLAQKTVRKTVVVPGRLVNFVADEA